MITVRKIVHPPIDPKNLGRGDGSNGFLVYGLKHNERSKYHEGEMKQIDGINELRKRVPEGARTPPGEKPTEAERAEDHYNQNTHTQTVGVAIKGQKDKVSRGREMLIKRSPFVVHGLTERPINQCQTETEEEGVDDGVLFKKLRDCITVVVMHIGGRHTKQKSGYSCIDVVVKLIRQCPCEIAVVHNLVKGCFVKFGLTGR